MDEKQEIIRLRNHFTYIFEQMWSVLALLCCILFSGEESIKLGVQLIQQGNLVQGLLAMGGVLAILLIICGWHINRWYRTTLTIQDGTITSTKATLKRRVNAMSIENISNINLEQNLFEMLVGTYKLKIDTNSLSTADTTDLEIVLKKKEAKEVKQLILMMLKEMQEKRAEERQERQGRMQQDGQELLFTKAAVHNDNGQKTFEEFDTENGTYDIVCQIKEIIVNGLITTSISQCIAAVALIASVVISIIGVLETEKDLMIIIPAIFLEILLAASVATSILKKWLQDFNFRAKRYKDKIYVSCGLLKKKSYVVPVDKINAVTLQYPFIGRLCKRAYVKVINIGGQGEEADGMKLLLADSYAELERKLQILLPEFTLPEVEEMRKPPKRVMGFSIAYMAIVAGAVFGGALFGTSVMEGLAVMSSTVQTGICVGSAAAVFFCSVYIRYMMYRASGILFDIENVVISRGIFAKTIQTIPYRRIQYIHEEQGPVQRKLHLKSGYLSILASMFSQIQNIGIFESNVFQELEERLKKTY